MYYCDIKEDSLYHVTKQNENQMFGAMFGAAMFGDGDDDDINEFFMGKNRFS